MFYCFVYIAYKITPEHGREQTPQNKSPQTQFLFHTGQAIANIQCKQIGLIVIELRWADTDRDRTCFLVVALSLTFPLHFHLLHLWICGDKEWQGRRNYVMRGVKKKKEEEKGSRVEDGVLWTQTTTMTTHTTFNKVNSVNMWQDEEQGDGRGGRGGERGRKPVWKKGKGEQEMKKKSKQGLKSRFTPKYIWKKTIFLQTCCAIYLSRLFLEIMEQNGTGLWCSKPPKIHIYAHDSMSL